MKANKYLSLLLILFIAVTSTVISKDKNTVYKQLVNKYGNLKSVSVDFTANDGSGMAGKLQAEKGNKYILDMSGRKIVCDGKKIWNYSKADNNVIISNYSDMEQSASIEGFFFNFLNNYNPVALEKVNSSSGYSGYMLTLKPGSNNEVKDINEIKLWLDDNAIELLGVALESDSYSQNWKLNRIKVNPNFSSSDFEFKIPENAEVITID